MSERPRLNLKPRDENAAHALDAARAAKSANNPFGAAKPREQVIAERLGKTEEEVLKEAVRKERPKLRLNAEQLEQRRAAEARIEEVRVQLAEAEAGTDCSQLEQELGTREAELEALLDRFEALALEAAQRGEVARPSERRQQQQQQMEVSTEGAHRAGGRGPYGGADRAGYAGGGGERGGSGSGGASAGAGGDRGERSFYERPRGEYSREGGGGRGGHGGEPREYDRSRSDYSREGGGRSGYVARGGGRTGYDRGGEGGGGGTYERGPRGEATGGSYERQERSYDRGGRGGSGGAFDRSGDADGVRSGGDWNAGGDRAGHSRGGNRGGYDRGGRAGGGGDRGFDDAPHRAAASGDNAPRGGYSSRGGYSDRGNGGGYERRGYGGGRGGRGGGFDPTLEDLTSPDYVSPYAGQQDRY
ncbi:hypothetical protein CHLRE_06g252850v5 [Chlamydomonas reinhardtii]|uniref:522875p n=1 Tax=Chlamydomonas reinhardtii TaxID=3055 RepID=D5LAW4_CHLRE|nr:uncharacterized protein CHLRE_06g252850v5 [Chlamydomonas reinhardtii]ADF43144.1 522875p [Chlamydomonas reinhardtii]PNW81586.1 hypothetical protein CHLRE_06g252850v5 [Chlamydomonas reinhardtii]